MNELEMYIPPQAEILHFAAYEALCSGYDDSWIRSGEGDASDNGIELPDDNWDGGNDDGGIELPDDKL